MSLLSCNGFYDGNNEPTISEMVRAGNSNNQKC